MKKIILSLTLVLFVAQVFSQTPTDSAYSKDYYLKKAKNQKTVAWILLGSGVGLSIVGAITHKTDKNEGYFREGGYFTVTNTIHYKNTVSTILSITGKGVALASISFFVSSHNNKKKAAEVVVGTQGILLPQQNEFVLKSQPTFTLKIPL